MLTTHNFTDPTWIFIEDTSTGCTLLCPHCNKEVDSSAIEVDSQCPYCQEIVYYPGWASW